MSKTFSLEEVAHHNEGASLWIIVHNQVYDISHYLEEHPGGAEVLKECAGGDATVAFEDVGHSDGAWANLEELKIGELAEDSRQEEVQVYRPEFKEISAGPILRKKASGWKRAGDLMIKAAALGSLGTAVYLSRAGRGGVPTLKDFTLPSGGSDAWGGFWLGWLSATATGVIFTLVAGQKLAAILNPGHNFQSFPPRRKAGGTRVLIKKSGPAYSRPVLDPRSYRKLPLAIKEKLSPNTYRFVFSLPTPTSVLGLPIGQHVAIQANIDGKNVSRSYTPTSNDKDKGVLELVIKVYPNGLLTNHMAALNIGDTLEFRGPKGAMTYRNGLCKKIGMIAGGTGITPMYQLIRAICEDPTDETTVDLLYANNTEADILLRDQLDGWAQKFPKKFRIMHVLSHPPEGWTGASGFVTKDMIKEKLPTPSPDTKIMLCGPPPMINAMKNNLDQLGFTKPGAIAKATDQIFLF